MRYVVIGASAAGISGAKTLRELDKEAEIILVSKDENVYSRCILHHYISNHRDVDALNFTSKDFFEENNITWMKGLEVKALNDAEQNLNYALPADKNKLKRIINDLRKNLIWLISSKKKWNVDMDSWQKDYHSRIKDSYIEYYKLDIDKNTYMIVNLTTNSKNPLQSYDWIGFTVFRDDGEFTTILEGETHST